MRFDDIFLAGLGSELPSRVATLDAVRWGWYDEAERHRSGVETVAVADVVSAPDLAARAAKIAVGYAGHAPDDYGALLHSATFHQGPDGWSAPHYILRRILDRPISALEIHQGCVGMLAALEMAGHRLMADTAHDAVLLTWGDNFSVPIVDRWRASRLFLLADGGAAAVVSRTGGFARVIAANSVSNPRMEELHRGGEAIFPPGITLGKSLDFEERNEYWRKAWAQGVTPPAGHLGDTVVVAVEGVLDDAGLDLQRIARVCHTAYSLRALHAIVLDPLGIETQRGTWDLARRVGHAGAGDPFIGLEYLWTAGDVVPGDHVLLLGAGPGIQVSAVVIEIVAPHRSEVHCERI